MNLHFCFAKREDIPNLVKLCNLCFEEDTKVEKALVVFDQTCHDPNQLYLIGILNGKIVAHTKITIVPTLFDGMEKYAILNHVCVDPEYRRHHIAKYMLEVIKKVCKDRGCIAINLWSKNFRQPAHKCYLDFGFEVVDAKFFTLSI